MKPMTWKDISPKWKRSMAFGVVYAVFALGLAGWFFWQSHIGDKPWGYLWAGPVGAFVGGTLLWRSIVAWKNKYSILMGALAGLITGLVFYCFVGYFLILYANVCYWIFGGCQDSLGNPPIDPFNALWLGSGAYFIWGLILFARFSVPAGVLLGGIVGFIQKRACQSTGE